jgi:hypothetical protein
MKPNLKFVCLSLSLCTAAMLAHVGLAQDPSANTITAPAITYNVATVYVAYRPANSSTNAIKEYVADNLGKLTELPGSPYIGRVFNMAVNGTYLFGNKGPYIETYEIQSNGTLHWVAETKYVMSADSDCDESADLFLDHTGATLYNADDYVQGCANNGYQSFAVQKSSGKLTFLNSSNWTTDGAVFALSFTGNNQFAYTSNCYHFTPYLYAFRRNSNGTLTALGNLDWYTQPKPPSGDFYCLNHAAADPADHVAIAVQPFSGYGDSDGPYQLATFTANSSGYLNTSSTYANMPKVAVGEVTALSISPSGKLLAVGGYNGLQVFHFNGASPVTPFTGLLTTARIDQIFWDNNNHLYAISTSANKLFVYGVTPNWHGVASGSPYTINSPWSVAVQPKPR